MLPPLLRTAGAVVAPGVPVAGGVGIGHAVVGGGAAVPDSLPLTGATDVDAEVRLVEEAFGRMLQRYDERIAGGEGRVETDVLRAHRSVARDPEFSQAIVHALRTRGRTAAGAIVDAESLFTGMLAATGSALLRERALDIRDVCRDLLAEVYGPALREPVAVLTRDSVCVADTLTPGQFLALDRRWLRGLALAHGGTTSHTVILARSQGVPTVVGVSGLDAAALDGQEVVVDADLGVLVSGLTDPARRYYDMERHRLARRRERMQQFAKRPATTEDGQRIEVGANIGSAADVEEAVTQGAEGVGLFRTEMLFLARKDAPDEDEQFEEYRRALTLAAGRPVIVRTLDVGGDKPLPYLALPREDNPFLGYRAVRIYPEFDALFRTQVRALLRASAFGPLRVMIPMVASLDEVRWVRAVVDQERAGLDAQGVACAARMPLGAMVEVPAAAFMVRALSRELDFFSIGTNDLLQYFLAADRTNPRVAGLASPLEPPFLRLLDRIVSEAHEHGRWVGLCGEMGGQAALPAAAGRVEARRDQHGGGGGGVHQGPAQPPVGRRVPRDARRRDPRLHRARGRALLDRRGHWRPEPLIEPDLVALDVDARSKEEAIKAAVDLLYTAGRADRPREVEEAVWQPEASCSTGFAHGFAIPHCKTDAVAANSVALVRLREGVAWGPKDEPPVHTILLLAIRLADQATTHMTVLSSLARSLMHEEFRDELMRAPDANRVVEALRRVIQRE